MNAWERPTSSPGLRDASGVHGNRQVWFESKHPILPRIAAQNIPCIQSVMIKIQSLHNVYIHHNIAL